MKKTLKIAVAIPTFNRLSRLQNAIHSIEQQQFDPDQIELSVVLANSASYDGTTEYIDSLRDSKVKFVAHNEVSFSKEEANAKSGAVNWSRLAAAVPDQVDWVWFMGDDDYLKRKTAISGIAEALKANASADLAIAHVSQARRSRKTGRVLKGKLIDLCNTLGFHEMLGWMSSLVIRRDIFKSFMALKERHYSESAYGQSAAFLELAAHQHALFVDADWVETQDDQQTPESIQRWAEVGMGERYFYVVDGVLSQFERGILQEKLKPVFYRYHTYSLWDRYACYLIARVVNNGMLTEKESEHWNRVRRISETIADPVFVKLFLAWHASVTKQFERIVQTNRLLQEQKKALIEYHNQMAAPSYPAEELLASLIKTS